MFQGTQFSGTKAGGGIGLAATGISTSIDEETQANVVAYATFDDVGGTLAASASGETPMLDIYLTDNESKSAAYHVPPTFTGWYPFHPTVTHTKSFVASSSVKPIDGTGTDDIKAIIFYNAHSDLNISASKSFSLWFYPTDLSQIGAETFRYLLYRYIDASNEYGILIKPADSKIYVFVKEAGATTKLVSGAAVNLNQWNNIIVTYNPSGDLLVIYLNGSSTSSTPADSMPAALTSTTALCISGVYLSASKRFTGYLDNFVCWSGKILTSQEAANMWSHGTIV